LVERHTRYVMLAKVANKDTQTVVSALIKKAKKLPTPHRRPAAILSQRICSKLPRLSSTLPKRTFAALQQFGRYWIRADNGSGAAVVIGRRPPAVAVTPATTWSSQNRLRPGTPLESLL
jgi:hypothetical protein